MDDAVNHPSHYTDGNIKVIDFIEDKKLPYHLGNKKSTPLAYGSTWES